MRSTWYNKGSYQIDSLPGCDQIAVSHSVFLFPRFRGKGLGRDFAKWRNSMVRELGFDYILCTVAENNEAQLATMGEDWVQLAAFHSRKTDRVVLLFGKEVH